MLKRNYGVASQIVRTMKCALVFVGIAASICSALDNNGFMDIIGEGKLTWEKKNPHHPKWEQMLNTVNIKTKKNYGLYGVETVKVAKTKNGGTLYDITFWAITEKNDLPTCRTQFFIPLFGRHRDMTIKSYDCENETKRQDIIAELSHSNLSGEGKLVSLIRIQ